MSRQAKKLRIVMVLVGVAMAALAGCRDATAPQRSCAGARLLYTESGGPSVVQIETANGDGSGRNVLIQTQPGASAAAWSPDGCQIAYTADARLFVANADGSGAHAIFTAQMPLDYPAWRPDGRELLFTYGYGFGARVWRIRSDGLLARPLTSDTLATFSASWSSDGALIAYTRAPRSGYTWPMRLVVIGNDGSGAHVVMDSINQGPAWVPGTHRIAYGRYGGATTSEIRIVGADGSDDRLLAGGLPQPFDLTWAAAADTLFFAGAAPTSPDFMTHDNIYVVKADGSGFGEVIAGAPTAMRPSARR